MNDRVIVSCCFAPHNPEYYAKFGAHCQREKVTPQEMIAQLIALELNPPNVVWGPWKPAA